ncbi:hypothetical protein [Desulfosporosinus fructosivorans]
MEVNKGSEAAAATAVEITLTAAAEPLAFIADQQSSLFRPSL